MAEVRLLGERVEEGERKRGWRKRKEENGVQAPNRAEIILDHKGWNSRKSKDILRIANRLWRRERGEMNKTLEPRVRSKFLSLMMAARVVRSNLFSLMMAASTSQLDLSRKKSQWHIVINFFLKNTSSPVNVMEKWRTAGRCWKENSYAKMRSWRELKKNWNVLRMTLFIYP